MVGKPTSSGEASSRELANFLETLEEIKGKITELTEQLVELIDTEKEVLKGIQDRITGLLSEKRGGSE